MSALIGSGSTRVDRRRLQCFGDSLNRSVGTVDLCHRQTGFANSNSLLSSKMCGLRLGTIQRRRGGDASTADIELNESWNARCKPST